MRSDTSTCGQNGGRATARQIEDHPDITSVAEGSGARERAGGGLLQADSEREHERTGTVIDGDAIVRVRQLLPEEDLREIVAARGELVQHLTLGQQLRFFDVIECARGVQQIRNPVPVGVAPRGAGRLADTVQGAGRCSHARLSEWQKNRDGQPMPSLPQ